MLHTAVHLPVLAHNKTNFFKNEMKRTMGLSLLASLIVLIMPLRSFRSIVISIIVAFASVIITFGLQGLLGIAIDVGVKESICHAIKETGWPIMFTALTTIGA